MVIYHNMAALRTLLSFHDADKRIYRSVQRLSNGIKINSSREDAAALAIATKMDIGIRKTEQAARNSLDGISLIQTAEGALNEITNILQRMRELAVQTSNGVLEADDREKIQLEIDSLKQEIDAMSFRTEFNGIKVLNGAASRLLFGNNDNVARLTFVSDETPAGNLVYTIDSAGVPAKISTPRTALGTGVTGTLMLNGDAVQINAADSETDIINKLIASGQRNGIKVYATSANLYFLTAEAGSAQKIELVVNDPALAASLGLATQTTQGLDAAVSGVSFYDRHGNPDLAFNASAAVQTDGNRIYITSFGGRKIVADIQFTVDPNADFFLADGTVVNNAGVLGSGPRTMGGNVKEFGPLILQTGPSKDMETMLVIPRITAESLGVAGLNYLSQGGATHALSALDSALNDVASVRSRLGAYQNRLEFTGSSLDLQVLNARSSLSRIMDTDMAFEMTNYTRDNVISQAAMSVLAQANKRPEQILQLL